MINTEMFCDRKLQLSNSIIKEYHSVDFGIDTNDLITINDTGCLMILFYGNNRESELLAEIWGETSQQVIGPKIGVVNMLLETELSNKFAELSMKKYHPLNWASLQSPPFILIYREGWPFSFYNGIRSTEAIIEFSLKLACSKGYHDRSEERPKIDETIPKEGELKNEHQEIPMKLE